jgi:hypothetical protein
MNFLKVVFELIPNTEDETDKVECLPNIIPNSTTLLQFYSLFPHIYTNTHRHTIWGVQEGRRWRQATHPASGHS